jgi:hypothetical protein
MSKEFAGLESAVTNASDEVIANQVITLTGRSTELVNTTPTASEQRGDVVDADRSAWCIAIDFAKHTGSLAARNTIIQAWNSSLVDKPSAAYQVGALGDEWDRDFLTDSLWGLLNETTNSNTILSFSYVIAKHGTEADATRLRAKKSALHDPALAGEVQNALNWMEYWRNHNTNDPGPAALAPTPVQ